MRSDRIQARISSAMERQREKMAAKVEKLRARQESLAPELEALREEIQGLEAELEAWDEETAPPGKRERLEARHERLLAKEERLEWKQEILETEAEALEDAASSMQVEWTATPPAPPSTDRRQEEERLKILGMVSEGTITADEAARLLEALDKREKSHAAETRKPRLIRVRVTDLETGTVRVNISLPLSIIRRALRRGGRRDTDIDVAGVKLDADELDTLLNSGVQGHIVDVVDDEDGERVEVIVE